MLGEEVSESTRAPGQGPFSSCALLLFPLPLRFRSLLLLLGHRNYHCIRRLLPLHQKQINLPLLTYMHWCHLILLLLFRLALSGHCLYVYRSGRLVHCRNHPLL